MVHLHICLLRACDASFRNQSSNEDIETMKGAERPETRSTSPIDHVRDRCRIPLACFFPFAQAGMPQQAISAMHMNVVPACKRLR